MTYVACCVVRIFGHPYAVRNTHHDTASNMDLKRLHRWTGIVTVIVFLMTGLYMRWQFPDLYAGNETIRHLFRANHIYLLMAGLLNVGLGLYFVAQPSSWRRTLQRAGSALLLAAPVLLLAAFFFEPPHPAPERPITAAGLFAALLGMLGHFAATFFRRRRGKA